MEGADPLLRLPGIRIPPDTFRSVAGGTVDAPGVRFLLLSERGRRLLLLKNVLDVCRREPGRLGPLISVEPAEALLLAVEKHAPDVLDALLTDPHVGMALAHLTRQIGADASSLWHEVGAVTALAATAGVHAGLAFNLLVPIRNGTLFLPALGQLRLSCDDDGEPAVARLRADEGSVVLLQAGLALEVRRPLTREVPGWTPLRTIQVAGSAGTVLRVRVDDLDPVPVHVGLPLAAALDAPDFERWRCRLSGAWQLLDRDYPREASAMAAGLKVLIPLPGDGPRSGSSGEGFGAAAMCLPNTDVDLASSLLHEFTHSVLNGLLHLVQLSDEDLDGAVHYAPWRDDPRPLPGMLHGAYAFTAVTAFWSVRRELDDGSAGRRADLEFATWRLQTARVLERLAGSGRLHPLGQQMIGLLRERFSEWSDCDVAPETVRLAELAAASHRAGWRVHHVQVDRVWEETAVRAWTCGAPAPAHPVGEDQVITDPSAHGLDRLFLRARSSYADDAEAGDRQSGGPDGLLVRGHPDEALKGYLAELAVDPFDIRPWLGLSPCLLERSGWASSRGAELIIETPEQVRALQLTLLAATGELTDVITVADWMAAST